MNSLRKTPYSCALRSADIRRIPDVPKGPNSMTVTNSATMCRSLSRLSSDELDVLEKLGQDRVTVNLDITLKPITWLALQKYAHKHDCSLAEAVESGLEDSEQVASGINIRLADQ